MRSPSDREIDAATLELVGSIEGIDIRVLRLSVRTFLAVGALAEGQDRIAAQLATLIAGSAPPQAGRWSITTTRGIRFSGGSPMAISIQEGTGVDGTFEATDVAGEVDTAATVTFDSSDSSILEVTDHGGGAFSADAASGATAGQAADVQAHVTDPDGQTVMVPATVTILAGDATGGAFTFGAQRPSAAAGGGDVQP